MTDMPKEEASLDNEVILVREIVNLTRTVLPHSNLNVDEANPWPEIRGVFWHILNSTAKLMPDGDTLQKKLQDYSTAMVEEDIKYVLDREKNVYAKLCSQAQKLLEKEYQDVQTCQELLKRHDDREKFQPILSKAEKRLEAIKRISAQRKKLILDLRSIDV